MKAHFSRLYLRGEEVGGGVEPKNEACTVIPVLQLTYTFKMRTKHNKTAKTSDLCSLL